MNVGGDEFIRKQRFGLDGMICRAPVSKGLLGNVGSGWVYERCMTAADLGNGRLSPDILICSL